MITTAAVVPSRNAPLPVVLLDLDEPRLDEAPIRFFGAGVCHTDPGARHSIARHPPPAVLGHEGTGVAEADGASVTGTTGSRRRGGLPEGCAPLGCGFQTGGGPRAERPASPVGASIAIFGTGAVVPGTILATRLSPVSQIIAVDGRPERLELTAELGATHLANPREHDVELQLGDITQGRGIDSALDTSGVPRCMIDVWRARWFPLTASSSATPSSAIEQVLTTRRGRAVIRGAGLPLERTVVMSTSAALTP